MLVSLVGLARPLCQDACGSPMQPRFLHSGQRQLEDVSITRIAFFSDPPSSSPKHGCVVVSLVGSPIFVSTRNHVPFLVGHCIMAAGYDSGCPAGKSLSAFLQPSSPFVQLSMVTSCVALAEEL